MGAFERKPLRTRVRRVKPLDKPSTVYIVVAVVVVVVIIAVIIAGCTDQFQVYDEISRVRAAMTISSRREAHATLRKFPSCPGFSSRPLGSIGKTLHLRPPEKGRSR